jgi:hypothetical protein
MSCAECEAFESAYRKASDHYASIPASLQEKQEANPDDYRKLNLQAEVAKGLCVMTKEALRVHTEGHKKPASGSI